MESVYIETTIPSYLISKSNRDIVILGHQMITQEWWNENRFDYHLFSSEIVLDEIKNGNPENAQERFNIMKSIPLLRFHPDIKSLFFEYQKLFHFSEKQNVDFLHISYAVYYQMDFLLTWNCKHLANAQIQSRLKAYNKILGYNTPIICTPEELIEPTWEV
ncbi:MAG: hypothetical protein A2Y33_01105 [Spirochaetes bacterium GWF1_51_8]|nr:MAG: hypothetical protein A2Y33_01105 [Spirochaetes bacterium GWF1_51_8]